MMHWAGLMVSSSTKKEPRSFTLILKEIGARLQFLQDVGLNTPTPLRSATTLGGGEAQRIRLATQIGSGLMGVLYVLDEPSIGLHNADNDNIIVRISIARSLGNLRCSWLSTTKILYPHRRLPTGRCTHA